MKSTTNVFFSLTNQICEAFFSANPTLATKLLGTHLDQVTLPYTPIDPNKKLLKKVKKMPSTILQHSLIDILTLDSLLSNSMKHLPLIGNFITDPLTNLIYLVNEQKQPVKTPEEYQLFIIRFYNTVDMIRIINQILLSSAKIGYKMNQFQLNSILDTFLTTRFTETVLQLQPKLQNFYSQLYLPFANQWKQWLQTYYFPLCKTSFGLYDLPSNKHLYSSCILYHTGHSFTPEQIFSIGTKAILSLRKKQEQLIQEHFPGITIPDFINYHLRGSKNRFSSPEDMVQTVKELLRSFDQQLQIHFDLPQGYRTPTLTSLSDPTKILGWADPASFFVNTAEWNTIPKSDMVPFTLHEAIPGHAFQLQFNDTPDCLVKMSFFMNVIEGIGLYAEECFEPTDLFPQYSRLNYHMWRALRLVVDCGIHYKGWTLDKSLDLMKYYCYHDPIILKTEILRYANNPGQACSYYIGYLDLKRMEKQWKEKHPESNHRKYAFFNEVLKYSRYSMASIAKALDLQLDF